MSEKKIKIGEKKMRNLIVFSALFFCAPIFAQDKIQEEDQAALAASAKRIESLRRELQDAETIHQLNIQVVKHKYQLKEGDKIHSDGSIERKENTKDKEK